MHHSQAIQSSMSTRSALFIGVYGQPFYPRFPTSTRPGRSAMVVVRLHSDSISTLIC